MTKGKCEKEMNEKCPMRELCRVIGDFWSMLIMYYLKDGPQRFNAILELTYCSSTSTLTTKLKELTEKGFIARKEYKEVPPRVEYELTAKGLKIVEAIKKLSQEIELA